MKPTKKPMMAKRTTKAAPAKKKMMASAKKPMTANGKKVQKYQVGGMAAPGKGRVTNPGGPSATMPPSNPRVVRPRMPQTGGVNPRPAAPGVGYGGIGRPGVQGRPGQGMIANNGGGMMSPPSRPNIPGITPPMNRPVRTPPQPQGMPQGMNPAMQLYAQQYGQMPQPQGMPQGGLLGAGPMQQLGQGMPQGGLLGAGPMQQLGQGMQGMDPRMHPDYQSPKTIDLRDPAMAARYGHLGRGPQPLTQEQLQQLGPMRQLGLKRGGEVKKKKAPAQGRMAKPARRKK